MRFDLAERKEFKFNFHFVFQLGETCKIADAKAAFSWGEAEGFFSAAITKSELRFRVKMALLLLSAPMLSTAETLGDTRH